MKIPRRRSIILAVSATLFALALLATGYLWSDARAGNLDHTTNPNALSMAISQAELDEIAELHTQVDGEPVTEVLGTAHGALLVLDHGVVALSGAQWPGQRDGHWPEQWRYLGDERITDVEVLPTDNANEPIALTKGKIGDADHSVKLLDSHTGTMEQNAEVGEYFDPGDKTHLTSDAILRQSGRILASHPLGNDGASLEEAIWTLDTADLCPAGYTVTEPADITSSPRGFIISLRCVGADEGDFSQVILHQDSGANPDQSGMGDFQRGRMVWEDVDPDSQTTEIHFMSSAIVPDSPDDIISDLIRDENESSYALALPQMDDDPGYHAAELFQEWDTRGYFSEPLTDPEIYPENLIMGRIVDLDGHISMQGAKLLLGDSSVSFSREDSSILQWDFEGVAAIPQSYRAYETPYFTLDLNPEIEQALS